MVGKDHLENRQQEVSGGTEYVIDFSAMCIFRCDFLYGQLRM